MDFNKILNRGKKVFKTKDRRGEWNRCEECSEMAELFPYVDDEGSEWQFCENCIAYYSKEEAEK
jgi:hypothetical protein